MLPPRPARGSHHAERGSALVLALFVSLVLGLLGVSFLAMGELEQLQARNRVDRLRCREAARDLVELAAAWLDASREPPLAPPAGGWDVEPDWATWGEHGVPATARVVDPTWLDGMGWTLGNGLRVEHLELAPAPRVDGHRTGLAMVACTVSAWRGGARRAGMTASGRVVRLAGFHGPDVVAAGGSVTVEAGSRISWGRLRAGGDVQLPELSEDGFPWSGLPRRASGDVPLDFAPGGTVDWHVDTTAREYVLTELLGTTVKGLPARPVVAPILPDPWLRVAAGRHVLVGRAGRRWTRHDAARQPRPHDPEESLVAESLSHLLQHQGPVDVAADGHLARLADGLIGRSLGGGGAVRRFLLDRSADPRAEPTWREGGTGPARTAAEWLGGPGATPVLAVFASSGADPPARVVLRGGAGIVVVQAAEVLLDGSLSPAPHVIHAPGEPFLDVGLDADGDGLTDADTIGNGRWDFDADGDGSPDRTGVPDLLFDLVHRDVRDGRLPDGDRSPGGLVSVPHEPFLNLVYPTSDDDLGTRVAFSAEDAEWRLVEDLDGDGFAEPGVDRITTTARDEIGGLLRAELHFAGVVANPVGDVRVGTGFRMHGAVRAQGDVTVSTRARLSFDGALAREGWPESVGLSRIALADLAVRSAPRRAPRGHDGPAQGAGGDGAESSSAGQDGSDAAVPEGSPDELGGGMGASDQRLRAGRSGDGRDR